MIATTDPLTAARAAALFVSGLSACGQRTRTEVEAAIKQALRAHGGARGCAANMAAAYGDYPELASLRMFRPDVSSRTCAKNRFGSTSRP
jgi:hypothetical protein